MDVLYHSSKFKLTTESMTMSTGLHCQAQLSDNKIIGSPMPAIEGTKDLQTSDKNQTNDLNLQTNADMNEQTLQSKLEKRNVSKERQTTDISIVDKCKFITNRLSLIENQVAQIVSLLNELERQKRNFDQTIAEVVREEVEAYIKQQIEQNIAAKAANSAEIRDVMKKNQFYEDNTSEIILLRAPKNDDSTERACVHKFKTLSD